MISRPSPAIIYSSVLKLPKTNKNNKKKECCVRCLIVSVAAISLIVRDNRLLLAGSQFSLDHAYLKHLLIVRIFF